MRPGSWPHPSRRRYAAPQDEGLQFRVVDRLEAIERARDRWQRIFKTGRAIEKHHPVAFRNTTIVEALLVGGIGRRTLGAQQQPLLARDFVERGGNRLVRDGNGETFALA